MNFFDEKFDPEILLEGQLLLIDKPLKWTSFQVVNKIRWHFKQHYGLKKIKVGHAGTLDPLATGLLLIATGKMTKSIADFQAKEKEYEGSFCLGATTPSYDLETPIDQTFEYQHITPDLVAKKIPLFTGAIKQTPPLFSALKKDGKRLYEYARSQEKVLLKPREVFISSFEIMRFDLPELDFKTRCSKGTYIRSLAYDFGKALDSGAHLKALRRTAIGSHKVAEALKLE